MDYEGLEEQWDEVGDCDGVRLSWNVFPSSRMATSTSIPALRSLVSFSFRLQVYNQASEAPLCPASERSYFHQLAHLSGGGGVELAPLWAYVALKCQVTLRAMEPSLLPAQIAMATRSEMDERQARGSGSLDFQLDYQTYSVHTRR